MLKILHNPRCSKSRQTLQLLNDNNAEVEIVEYLKDTPSKEELISILEKLNVKPFDIIRKGEEIFKNKFKGETFSDDEWIDILVANPKLIERPIVYNATKAVIGRPPENTLNLL